MSRDRFTEKDENGKWAVRLSEDCQMTIERSEKVNNDGSKTCTPVFVYAPFVDQLAEYETLIFSPGTLMTIIKEWKEWADAKNDGRLMVLPCNVGDTVWVIDDRFVNGRQPLRCSVNEFTISDRDGKVYTVLDGAEEFYTMRRFKAVPPESFGRTVFLNEAEAKTALELIKKDGKHD
jgi:hypothetical protein